MIEVTPMYHDDEAGEWKRGASLYVNPDSIVMVSEVSEEEIGSMILIPDENGHGRLLLADSVHDVIGAIRRRSS